MRTVLTAAFAMLMLIAPTYARAAEWSIEAGTTWGVQGTPNDGGASASLSVLWPVHDRLSFGVTGYADDLGAQIGQLKDPAGNPIGAAEEEHRNVWGGGWRLDGFVGEKWGWLTTASTTWGYYRLQDDHRGQVTQALSSTGFSLGGAVQHRLGRRHSLGAVVRFHRMFNDVAGRYWNAGLAWSWGPEREAP
jgi:hypothetical protein